MKILQMNKFFYDHAGSETCLFLTRNLLQERGHQVIDFAMSDPRNVKSPYSKYFSKNRSYTDSGRSRSDRLRDALASVYSFESKRKLSELLKATRPDVAHLHLVYHQLTTSVIDALHEARVPIVMTLHDYKLVCPSAVMYRNGNRCSECAVGSPLPVVRHRCIKGSLAGSALGALERSLTNLRRTYHKIDHFICPSTFMAGTVLGLGVPADRVSVVPNFLSADELHKEPCWLSSGPQFLYAGRLEPEKGIEVLLDAFTSNPSMIGDATLVIAAAGGSLEEKVKSVDRQYASIRYLGRLDREGVRAQMERSRAVIVPSLWDENYPMSVLEAFSTATPVICTERGGLPEMVTDGEHGIVLKKSSGAELAKAIKRLSDDELLAKRLGAQALARLRAVNNPSIHYDMLIEIFGRAIASRNGSALATTGKKVSSAL